MQQNKIDVGKLFLYVLVGILFLGAITQPTNATKGTRPAVDRVKNLVPTPITTPSSLDALNTTSDVNVGGNSTIAGTLGVTGISTLGGIVNSGGTSNTNYWSVSAPTAIASATPAARINSLGAGNDLLVVEKASTPVFKVGNSGNLTATGNLSINGTINGVKCYKGQQTVLGAATVIPATLTAAGISTPSWVSEGFAADIGNTYHDSSHTNAAGVVTIKVWSLQLAQTVTPQAATTSVAMDYEVCGQ